MNDVYILIGVILAGCFMAAHILWVCEKINVLHNEDQRDQEAHEKRMESGVYTR